MKLSEKIVKLRKENGLSQEEFGTKINVSRQAVSKWESEQSVPEVDKIKEIGKVFDISFDYLLNDELDEIPEKIIEEKRSNKKSGKIFLKIIFIIFIIYLLVCLYKFVVLYRFYKIADSFSEENYKMNQTWTVNEDKFTSTNYSITKVGNKRIDETSRVPYLEKTDTTPYKIGYLDTENKIRFDLNYNKETNSYFYDDYIQGAIVRNELDEILTMPNDIKDTTLSLIPSNFKEMIIASINPMCSVSIRNREIYVNNFNKVKTRVILTKDCLVESYSRQSEIDEGSVKIYYSYDYVQDHFNEIENPVEIYADKIENYEEIAR